MSYQRLSEWNSSTPTSESGPGTVTPDSVGNSTSITGAPRFRPPPASRVDTAVEDVLGRHGVPPHAAHAFRETFVRDTRNTAISEFFEGRKFSAIDARDYSFDKKFHVRYRLDEREAQTIISYVPEYRVILDGSISHDHPLMASMRHCDYMLVNSKVPGGSTRIDVGGDPIYHMYHENERVHVCNPLVDAKDASRLTSRTMKARLVLADRTRPEAARVVAGRFLASCEGTPETALRLSEGQFCRSRAQNCCVKADVLTSIHVYDIPIDDWGNIMEKHSSSMVVGAVHFSPLFLEDGSGILPDTRIHYTVDTKDDLFRMGFEGSPAWYYSHKWSEYVKYGVDRLIISSTKQIYSYHVEEVRADTIFFRVLRLCSDISPQAYTQLASQYLMVPTIDRMLVRGFCLDATGVVGADSDLKRKDYEFPRILWDRLVAEITVQFEAGRYNQTRLVNYYRSIAPTQSINSKVVLGGVTVDLMELPALLVHATLVAVMRVMTGRATTRALTDEEILRRMRSSESSFIKVINTLKDVSISLVTLPFYPFRALFRYLKSGIEKKFASSLIISWEPVARLKHVKVELPNSWTRRALPSTITNERGSDWAYDRWVGSDTYKLFLARTVARDEEVINSVAIDDSMPQVYRDMAEHLLAREGRVKRAPTDNETTPRPNRISQFPVFVEGSDTLVEGEQVVDRWPNIRSAISEAIREVELEISTVHSACRRAWRMCMLSGSPRLQELRTYKEQYDNPWLWEVAEGFLKAGLGGKPLSEFEHAAVCWYSKGSSSDLVISRAIRLQDGSYTFDPRCNAPYVMTLDCMRVYNGPEVLESLREALHVPEYPLRVKLYDGVPGCGKTYSIIQQFDAAGDIVFCPARESAIDTRKRMIQDGKVSEDAKLRVKTLDSYLVNRKRLEMPEDITRLLADEVFMAHSGKWYAAALLLHVSLIQGYGDSKQIPHIPRVQIVARHVRIVPDDVERMYVSRRVPADAVAAWNVCYEKKARSLNPVRRSIKRKMELGEIVPSKTTAFLTMYQSEKTYLRQYVRDHFGKLADSISVLTVHEAQGKTMEHVVLYRHDVRPRQDKASLYDTEGHVIVALSRHTKQFEYVCSSHMNDLVDAMIANATEVNTQNSADVETVGVPY